MSVTKFRVQPRGFVRLPSADARHSESLLKDQARQIARLEDELAEARREIERLHVAVSTLSPTNDIERAALRAAWKQVAPCQPKGKMSLYRWLRSLVSPDPEG